MSWSTPYGHNLLVIQKMLLWGKWVILVPRSTRTDHQALISTASIFQWTHRLITWKHNCGLLTCYQYFAEYASVIRRGAGTVNTCWCWKLVVNPQLHRVTGLSQARCTHFLALCTSSFKIVNIHQLLNTVMTPKISKYLCWAFPPAPLPLRMSGYETHGHAKHASALLTM